MTRVAIPFALLALAVALGLNPSEHAIAQSGSSCLYQCEGSTCADFGNHSAMCEQLRAQCGAKCSGSGRKSWGAIAYSVSDGGFGWVAGQADLDRAKKQALDNCLPHGKECKPWIWFSNECGAIAADGPKTGWGTANAKATAEQRALTECRNAGGKNCTVRASLCSL